MGRGAKSHRILKDWAMNRVDDKESRNIGCPYDHDGVSKDIFHLFVSTCNRYSFFNFNLVYNDKLDNN
ncbi:hypothetical protein M8C21_008088 [Ambrosia artemisiifolia]|uniref:Uncharacterized protein n=1 Tax=Ambrosia artemisiifolia TaxID=4212 RepID=A0AAD5G4E1_AMBAR|nr:hypothetical protein M8C21_008088 [Ambrosia artemisiifolia]